MPEDQLHPSLLLDGSVLTDLTPVRLQGTERLSAPYRFTIDLLALTPTLQPWADLAQAWLNKPVALDLKPLMRASEECDRWISGVVSAVEQRGGFSELYDHDRIIRIEVVPPLWRLGLTRRTRVFTDKTPLDTAVAVLKEHQVPIRVRATAQNTAHANALPHITQYDETDLDFVCRILEEEGVCFWFVHARSGVQMVLGNSADHHPGEDMAIEVKDYQEVTAEPHGLGRRAALTPAKAESREYMLSSAATVSTFAANIPAGISPVSSGATAVYGRARVKEATTLDRLAKLEGERQACRAARFDGTANDLRFRPGNRVKLPDGSCLIVASEHTWVHGSDGSDTGKVAKDVGGYSNRFTWVPWQVLPWRPALDTPMPRIAGVLPAKVTATAGNQGDGDEAALDGSYRVQILNCPGSPDRVARLAQPYGGSDRGVHFPIQPGTEVLLTHLHGHPDLPVIAAVLPNTDQPGPVLEANKTQGILKTQKHRLVFEDKDDEESITLTSKAQSTLAISDKPDTEMVVLASGKGHGLTMDDKKDEATVTLKSTAGNALFFADKADHQQISLTTAGGHAMVLDNTKSEGVEPTVSLTSAAGHSLVFDDKQGAEKIILTGKGGDVITLDEKDGSQKLSVTAAKDLAVSAEETSASTSKKAMSLKTEDEMTIEAAKKITIKVGNASITLDQQGNIEIKGMKISITGDSGIELSASGGDLKGSGLNVTLSASASAKLSGSATAELSASGQTTVKGAMVMIN